MQGQIVDASVLGNSLIIYGTTQNFIMRADGSQDVYSFDRLPFDGGAINANCSEEIDGLHYVFGPNDVYKHDGISKSSVIDGVNSEFLFGTLNASKASKFFTKYNTNQKTLSLYYVSGDAYVASLAVRAAIARPSCTSRLADGHSTMRPSYTPLSCPVSRSTAPHGRR
jgi:hypothetical protein